MPLIPNTAALQRRIATLPLATYQPGETVIAAGTKTGRLLILRKGAVVIEKGGTVIAKVTEPGAARRQCGKFSNAESSPNTEPWKPRSFASRPSNCSNKIPAHFCTSR